MKSNLNCDIVKDLLPSYIDELVSEETAAEVKAHLESCEVCRTVYNEMTGSEPVISEQREIDYLKKVNRSKKIIGVCAVCAALAAGLIFALSRINAAKPKASYDAETKSLVVSGSGNYDKLKLADEVNDVTTLDVQDDDFHLSVYVPLLRNGDEPLTEYLPGYIDRTDKSLEFIRNYLKKNAASVYPEDKAEKPVEINIREKNYFLYANESDRISLNINDYYWHREELYLLAMMDAKSVEWPQLGYAWYMGTCLDPYYESLGTSNINKKTLYYDICVKAGVDFSNIKPEDWRIIGDAVSYVCLTKGVIGWGTAYESLPVTKTALYSGPRTKNGLNSEMSVMMAQSFVAWLDEHYGFENLSAFCFGEKTFIEVFGTDAQSAFAEWSEWILTTYGA